MNKRKEKINFSFAKIFPKSSKGEMTTQQIIGLIILIASFSIILFLLVRLNLQETTDKELCHNSVIMRSQSVLPSETIPLNCRTSYVCITSDGSCEKMTKPNIKKVNTKEEVYGLLAENMADCWWMFGEGKVNYVGDDMLPSLYCSICSQIAFDDSMIEIFEEGKLNKTGLYDFMKREKFIKENKETNYLRYFYGTEDYSEICSEENNCSFGEIDLTNQYYVMMGITSDVNTLGYIGVGIGTIAGSLVLAPVSVPLIAGVLIAGVGGAAAGTFAGTVVEGVSGNDFIPPMIIEAGSEEFKSLECESIETLS